MEEHCSCTDCPYPHFHATKNQYDPQLRRRGCMYGGEWVPEGTPIIDIDWRIVAGQMAGAARGKTKKAAIAEIFDAATLLNGKPWKVASTS